MHFIPKNKSLISFWKDKYFKEIKYEYDDMKSANDFISKLLIGKNDLYDIYAYHVEKEYLKSNNGCTIESVYLNNNSFAKIYFYNQDSKKWIFKKSINTEILPPYPDTNFFKSNFPEETDGKSIEKGQISTSQEKSEDHITYTNRLSVTEIKNIDISGTWKSHCNNKKSSNLLLIGGSISKNISGTLEIYNNKKDYIAKMMVELSPDTKTIIYIDTSIIGEDIDIETLTSFSKGEMLANIKILDKDTISINWVGLHNIKTNKRLFQQNPFGNKNPFILTKCRD